MSRFAQALRLDEGTWRWLEYTATRTGATAVAIGSFLLLAYDRFGWPDSAPRATTRFVLTGFYGWLWLTLASFVLVRFMYKRSASPFQLLRLVGHAHLPLLATGIFIQVVAVSFDVANVSRWPALFAGLLWMPAMLGGAIRVWADLDLRRSLSVVVVPYVAWAAIVGRYLWDQLDHLL